MSDAERWRPIPDWEGLYEVSDHGRVRGLPRTVRYRLPGRQRRWPGRVLAPHVNPSGYRTVQLCRDGQTHRRMVDRLVLAAHVGPPPEGQQACHRGEPGDDRAESLYWGMRVVGRRTYRSRQVGKAER